jgi:hypothetical protein
MIVNKTSDTIELNNRISIEVRATNFRRLRGVSAVAVLATEAAFWFSDETSENADSAILTAVRPALATTGGPLIILTSPYARKGEVWELFSKNYGPSGDPDILVVKGESRTFNPTLPQSVVDRALERDYAAASAEYLARFRTDVESLLTREAIEAVTIRGRYELPPQAGVKYSAFVDPSGGSADSMTLAIGHEESGIAILDAVREVKPPFSPEAVVLEFSALLKTYNIREVTGDKYAGLWPRERFDVQGIRYVSSEKTTSDLYLEFLPLVNGGRVQILDHKRLLSQLTALERRTSRTGKDLIGHRPNQHDDLANCISGVLVGVTAKPKAEPLVFVLWDRFFAAQTAQIDDPTENYRQAEQAFACGQLQGRDLSWFLAERERRQRRAMITR